MLTISFGITRGFHLVSYSSPLGHAQDEGIAVFGKSRLRHPSRGNDRRGRPAAARTPRRVWTR
jgi:hypothetical protein